MKSFKTFIKEEWVSSMPGPYKFNKDKTVDIFKNPTKKELNEIIQNSEAHTARGIFHGNDVYLFDAMMAIHHDVSDHLKLQSRSRNFFTVKRDRWGSEYVDNDETLNRITNHPWIKKTIPNHRFFHG